MCSVYILYNNIDFRLTCVLHLREEYFVLLLYMKKIEFLIFFQCNIYIYIYNDIKNYCNKNY